MSTVNLLIATNVALDLLVRAQQVTQLIATAKKEGRDVMDSEIDALVSADNAARAALALEIEKAKAAGQ